MQESQRYLVTKADGTKELGYIDTFWTMKGDPNYPTFLLDSGEYYGTHIRNAQKIEVV